MGIDFDPNPADNTAVTVAGVVMNLLGSVGVRRKIHQGMNMTTNFFCKDFLVELEAKYRAEGKIASAEIIRRSIARARGRKAEPKQENPDGKE